jgi:uncharacterized membrane protein
MTAIAATTAVVMVVTCGLWAGVIFTYAVERVNLWKRMPIGQYVVDFRRSIHRADPLQPILGVVAIIAGVVFALNAPEPAATAAWVGVGLIALVIVMSIALPERINALFRRRAEGEAPPDVEELRTRWRTLHYVRTVPAVAGFVAFAVSLVAAR